MRKKPEEAPVQKLDVSKELKKDESVKFLSSEAAKASSVVDDKKVDAEVKPTKPEPVLETICGRHLKTVDDLKSFPIFKDGEKGSLLSKHLTEDIWK